MNVTPQNPEANVDLRRGDYVAYKMGGRIIPALVNDDDVENPIREIRVSEGVRSEFAGELTPVDQETFEMLVVLQQEGVTIDENPGI